MGIRIGIGVDVFRVSGIDPSAASFLTAAGITDPTIVNAVNRFVLNYKGQGNLNNSVDLWAVSFAIYLFVGGTASAHKLNLKDSRDLDAAFRLSFSGGWTHSSNGILGNGTNSFANTFLNPSTQLSTSNGRFGLYIRNNINETRYDMGTVFAPAEFALMSRFLGNLNTTYGVVLPYPQVATSDCRGLNMVNRLSATNTTGYKNGSKVIDSAQTESRPNSNIYIGAANAGGTATNAASKQYAFGVIGAGLSDANSLLEYNIIQQFQTDLARQV
jgi:hypothetical protein